MFHPVHIQTYIYYTFPNRTYELDQTKITINGFVMAKSAAQLLYGPVLV